MPYILNEEFRTILAGAAGASFVAVTQLTPRDAIQVSHLVAIGCFSVTMPILAAAPAVPKFHQIEKGSRSAKIAYDVILIAGIILLLGVASILWVFGWYFAIAFVALCAAIVYLAGLISN
jgi:hypothetical protein